MFSFNFNAFSFVGQLLVIKHMKARSVSDAESMEFVVNSPELMLFFLSSKEDVMKKNKILELYKASSHHNKELVSVLEDAAFFSSNRNETIHFYDIMVEEANKFIVTADIENLL
jgi:hypothetical protein